MDLPSKNEIVFCGRFVLFTISWNLCEIQARTILQLILGESEPASAIAAEIQNRSLSNAIRASARDKRFAKHREHLEHFVTGYDLLLAYRNYYTHALVGVNGEGGSLLSISAKGRLGMFEGNITVEELNSLQSDMQHLLGYATAIRQELGDEGPSLPSVLVAPLASK